MYSNETSYGESEKIMQDEWGIDKNGETIYYDEYGTSYVRDENGNRRQ